MIILGSSPFIENLIEYINQKYSDSQSHIEKLRYCLQYEDFKELYFSKEDYFTFLQTLKSDNDIFLEIERLI